jgi:EB1-like C-terminal motif
MQNLSRVALLKWLDSIKIKVDKIENIGKGTALCDLMKQMDESFPKYKESPRNEQDYIYNLNLVMSYMEKKGLKPYMPIERMCKLKMQDNIEVAQWFYKFWSKETGNSFVEFKGNESNKEKNIGHSFGDKGNADQLLNQTIGPNRSMTDLSEPSKLAECIKVDEKPILKCSKNANLEEPKAHKISDSVNNISNIVDPFKDFNIKGKLPDGPRNYSFNNEANANVENIGIIKIVDFNKPKISQIDCSIDKEQSCTEDNTQNSSLYSNQNHKQVHHEAEIENSTENREINTDFNFEEEMDSFDKDIDSRINMVANTAKSNSNLDLDQTNTIIKLQKCIKDKNEVFEKLAKVTKVFENERFFYFKKLVKIEQFLKNTDSIEDCHKNRIFEIMYSEDNEED